MSVLQVYVDEEGEDHPFWDMGEEFPSNPAQPRDIVLISGEKNDKLKADIAIDIRQGQGISEIGIANGLLYAY